MTHYRVPDYVLRAQLEGDEVLLNPRTGEYHLVNETGRVLLQAFGSGRSLTEGIDDLAERAGQDAAVVRNDAETFVRAMVERGLLESVG